MNIEHLVKMANDIAAFFAADPDQVKAAGDVAAHLRRFWDPRMRKQIIEFAAAGGHGLSALGLEGVRVLALKDQK
jgi:formate dehydrogenase subunit delta